jgi:penicillin-insensitive murein endopeptidase
MKLVNGIEVIDIPLNAPIIRGVHIGYLRKSPEPTLCREAGADRAWLSKVRPWYGHAEHFHVQIACPASGEECKPQSRPRPSAGCGHELDFWFKESTPHPPPRKPKPPLTLVGLPSACKQIVRAP